MVFRILKSNRRLAARGNPTSTNPLDGSGRKLKKLHSLSFLFAYVNKFESLEEFNKASVISVSNKFLSANKMGTNDKYSVLLPTYNEKDNLPIIVWLLIKSFTER